MIAPLARSESSSPTIRSASSASFGSDPRAPFPVVSSISQPAAINPKNAWRNPSVDSTAKCVRSCRAKCAACRPCFCHVTEPSARVQRSTPPPSALFTISTRIFSLSDVLACEPTGSRTPLIQDLRYACRSFAKSPGFTAAAVLSLAIGIGANTSIFSVANALLLRPLPYPEVNRLVILWNRSPGLNITQDWFSTAQYFDIKSSHSGFEQLAIAIGGSFNLTGSGDPERVSAIRVSSNLLPLYGATAAQGRLFVAEEDAPGHAPTAI